MANEKGKVNKHLDKMITDLLKEVNSGKNEDGKPKYTLTDKCKVLDRAIKIEALRLKIDDSGYGSGFDEPEDDE